MAKWNERFTEIELEHAKSELAKNKEAYNNLCDENVNLKLRIAELEKQLAWPKVPQPKMKRQGAAPTSRFPTKEEFNEAMKRFREGSLNSPPLVPCTCGSDKRVEQR